MEEDGISLNLGATGSTVSTFGGWKIQEDKKITEQDLAKMIGKNLGIPRSNYTDTYGMSEMCGAARGCEGGYKHMAPWIYPMVLNDDYEPVGYGEWGRFAFLDPVINSYPGFIMTGDRVKMLEKCPNCDQPGVVLDPEITRMPGAEDRGCGNLMRDLMFEEMSKSVK